MGFETVRSYNSTYAVSLSVVGCQHLLRTTARSTFMLLDGTFVKQQVVLHQFSCRSSASEGRL